MKFYSTKNKDIRVSFQEAVFNSLPQDKGLYMPEEIPQLNPDFLNNLHNYSFQEISFHVAKEIIGKEIPERDLKMIIDDAINFDAPLKFLDANTAVLELFHGPSYAFKDFGARFMSRVMGYFSKEGDQLLDVLVATSGDTGGAVALGFLGVEGTRVTILYPKGKVSKVQEEQLTTHGGNIRALEVNGTFDDCQALVKQAFNDIELNTQLRLTSANSINIARLIPQTFYYFWAYAQLKAKGLPEVVFSVPSGNFGNLGAGLLAYKMGLPIKHFIAGTNINDTVPRFLESGNYDPKPSTQTLTNAMDVGDPSNWVRIQDLFHNDLAALRGSVKAYHFNDNETRKAMKELYTKYNYVACPHTAIAYWAVQAYDYEYPGEYASLFLSTAHPCKFPEAIDEEVYKAVRMPESAKTLYGKPKLAEEIPVEYQSFKNYLLKNQ